MTSVSSAPKNFHDETLAILRFAQKTAIAQRRAVCVDFAGSGRVFAHVRRQPSACHLCGCNRCAGACAGASIYPSGERFVGSARAFTLPMRFTPLGSTDQGAKLTVSIANSTDIFVEATTGYVHD